MSFFSEFFGIVEGVREEAVCCPFDHYTVSGHTYKESNPSAHVNTINNLFHCKVCDTGFNEIQFIQKYLGCDYLVARKIQKTFENNEDVEAWEKTRLTETSKETALNLGISEEVIEQLKLKTPTGSETKIAFPVFMYGHLLDIRQYNPEGKPKVKSRTNAINGLVLPFDLWSDKTTIICAGEKDMAIARSHGFNAITITGGENVLPKTPNLFKDKSVVIVYDNDTAGIKGATKLGNYLLKYTPKVKVVTNFHDICKEPKEDLTDFFMKYKKTQKDLIDYIKETPAYTLQELPTEIKENPVMSLMEASKPENVGKLCRSNIQIVAISESSFSTEAHYIAEKYKTTGQADSMLEGDIREWKLSEKTMQDILHLMDNNFREDNIRKNKLKLLKISEKERCVKLQTLEKKTVFKAYVTDMFETNDMSVQPMEFTAYSFSKLESGKKYLITYKLVPHPYKGNQLTMIIMNTVEANDSVSNFKITEDSKNLLKVISNLEGSVEEKMDLITEKTKGILGYNGNKTLIQTIDLTFHSVLQFHFGTFEYTKGCMDTLIIGESRVGKSSTADTLRKLYSLGTFVSLAGNSATIPGLIGGSNKTANGYQTRAGIIPQNHKGLIIFEEFGKSQNNILSELTDIRSSNEVRIARVSGTITIPALLRMIALSNVKAMNGAIKPIASYPNGITILTELVPTAEDIARYDMVLILSDRGVDQIDPLWQPEEPFPKEVYETKIRWAWSRKPEEVLISNDVALYIMRNANTVNRKYNSHVKIFGTEAWKKITKLAIATASYLVSTDNDFHNIIVKHEHVDYAVKFLVNLYDNQTFKFKEYVENERKYSETDEEALANLQDIYNKYPSLVLQMEQSSSATKNMLGAASGLNNDDLNKALNRLTKGLFIRFQTHDIIPTERFRLTLNNINKDTFVRRVGE